MSQRDQTLHQIFLNAIPSSVLVIDRNLRIVSVNRNFLEKSKRKESETLDRRLPEVLPPAILENLNIARLIQQAFDLGEPTPGDKGTYRTPGGLMRLYYYRVLPLAYGDRIENVILLIDDVTEQAGLSETIRQMERHLAIVVESASEIILSCDPDGRIRTWNQSAERISGYLSQEVVNQPFFRFCAAEHHDVVKSTLGRLRQGRRSLTAEWNLQTKAGGVIAISWTCSRMIDDDGHTIGIVITGRDLTETRKYEAQLLQAQKLAALGVMAGGIAHEIRNPLAISFSAAQFLQQPEITPAFRQECVEKLLGGIERASAIIERLLRFARPSEHHDFAALNLVAVLAEALSLVNDQAKVQHVDITTRFPETTVAIRGDAGLLQQVFLNLLINALNAMPHGGRLEVHLEADPGEVRVAIADSGHGIAAADLNNIFDPFYAKSGGSKGTGLGLPLSYSIVKHHAGHIEVQSVEAKGTTFTVRLPLAHVFRVPA